MSQQLREKKSTFQHLGRTKKQKRRVVLNHKKEMVLVISAEGYKGSLTEQTTRGTEGRRCLTGLYRHSSDLGQRYPEVTWVYYWVCLNL